MMFRTLMLVVGVHGLVVGQRPELFAILDRLDSLDTRRHPCVCVVHRGEGREWRQYGFQLDHDGKTVRVQWLTLQRETIRLDQNERDSRGRMVRRTLEPADLKTTVPILISKLKAGAPLDTTSLVGAMHGTGEAIVLARALEQNGLNRESKRLLSLVPDAHRQLARGLARRVALDRTDPRYSWQDLLDRHNAWLESFDDTNGTIESARDQIQRIVDERKNPKMSPVRRALLDELWLNSNDLFDQSMVKPPVPAPEDGTRPLDRILALGIDAIPELIELLDDKTPTRACSHTARFGGVLRPCPLRNQASAVLSYMSGLPWQFVPDEQQKYRWINWYAEVLELGLEGSLAKRLALLQPTTIATYLDRWPDKLDRVLTAIRQKGADADRMRSNAISALLRRPGLLANETVLAACRAGASASGKQFQRARIRLNLLEHGDLKVLPDVVASFNQQDVGKVPISDHYQSRHFCQLLDALLRHPSLNGWQTIEASLDHQPGRFWLATELIAQDDRDALRAFARKPAHAAIMHRALGRLLELDEPISPRLPLYDADRGAILLDVRYDDAAALALAAIWPERYHYLPKLESGARRAQIAEIRAAHVRHAKDLR